MTDLDPQQVINPEIWAEAGGLIGLVILALFAALGAFLWGQLWIYKMHRADIKEMMGIHAQERKSWIDSVDMRQKETNMVIMAMTSAIDRLNDRAKRFTDKDR